MNENIFVWQNGFTIEYNKVARGIVTPVEIESTYGKSDKIKIKALWDTGATFTVIHSDIAKQLNLKCVSKEPLGNISGGTDLSNLYCVNIIFPNDKKYKILVTEAKPKGCDMLIGMDIISNGDFAISCYKDKTVFTYRTPSLAKIDFSETPYLIKSEKTGRNEPCPCGSGKKYKHCCLNKIT